MAEFELFNFGVFEVQVEGVPGFSLVPLFERPYKMALETKVG